MKGSKRKKKDMFMDREQLFQTNGPSYIQVDKQAINELKMKKNSLRLKTLESKFDKQFLLFKKIIDELE